MTCQATSKEAEEIKLVSLLRMLQREEMGNRERSPWKDYLSRKREPDPSYSKDAPDTEEGHVPEVTGQRTYLLGPSNLLSSLHP